MSLAIAKFLCCQLFPIRLSGAANQAEYPYSSRLRQRHHNLIRIKAAIGSCSSDFSRVAATHVRMCRAPSVLSCTARAETACNRSCIACGRSDCALIEVLRTATVRVRTGWAALRRGAHAPQLPRPASHRDMRFRFRRRESDLAGDRHSPQLRARRCRAAKMASFHGMTAAVDVGLFAI